MKDKIVKILVKTAKPSIILCRYYWPKIQSIDESTTSHQLIKTKNEERLDNQLGQMWNNVQGCTHTKCFISTPDKSITNQIITMSKQDTRIIAGLLTGHKSSQSQNTQLAYATNICHTMQSNEK